MTVEQLGLDLRRTPVAAMTWAIYAFVAVMAVQTPRVPGPFPIGWAELFFPFAAAAFAWRIRGRVVALGPAALTAFAYATMVAVSAAAHRAGGLVALGALELATVMSIVATMPAVRLHIVRIWIAAAAVLSVVGLTVAALTSCGAAVAPLYAGSGELGLTLRPAGLCRTGMLAAICIVPFVVLVAEGARVVGRWRWPLLVLFGGTLAATLTRTILAVTVGVIVLSVLRARQRRRTGAVAVAVLALVAIVSMRIDLHGADGRFQLTSRAGIRWRIARSALTRALASPLVGVGPAETAAIASWPTAADPLFAWDAHSTLLDVAASRGLPAAALWLVTAALVLATALRRREADALHTALVAALAATLFDALTIDLEDARHVWVLFGLVVAPAATAATTRVGGSARESNSPNAA